MTEADVALTDYALFVECSVFAWLAFRWVVRRVELHAWVVAFFASTALAALFGGTLHGFFSEGGGVGVALWKLSLLAIGATALAGLVIGARLALSETSAVLTLRAGVVLFAGYAALVLFVNDAFWVAIAGYLPAALLMLFGFGRAAVRHGSRAAMFGALGLVLTFVAAAIQWFGFGVHPVYFSHNALYHVVQAAGLAFIFVGCRGLLQPNGGPHADAT